MINAYIYEKLLQNTSKLQFIIEKIKTTVNAIVIKLRFKSVLKYKKIKVHF